MKFILVVSIPTVNHTDTIFGQQFNKIESEVSQLGVPYSFLQLPFLVDKDTLIIKL